jgi:hypothetical protein
MREAFQTETQIISHIRHFNNSKTFSVCKKLNPTREFKMNYNRLTIFASMIFVFSLTNCGKTDFRTAGGPSSLDANSDKSAQPKAPTVPGDQDVIEMICKSQQNGEAVSLTVIAGKDGLRGKLLWVQSADGIRKTILNRDVNLVKDSSTSLIGYNPETTAAVNVYSMGLKGYPGTFNAKIAVQIGKDLGADYPKRKVTKSYLYYAECH